MKLFEAFFTFSPPDDSAGEGVVTVSANSEEEVRSAILEMMGQAIDLQITEIREVVELPENVNFTPRTLQ